VTVHIPAIPPRLTPRPPTLVGRIEANVWTARSPVLDVRTRPGSKLRFPASGRFAALARSVGARPNFG
jgi:hypothetical protein